MRPSIPELVAIHADADARVGSRHAVDHLQVHGLRPDVDLVDVGRDRRAHAGRIGARPTPRSLEDPARGGEHR